MSAWAGWAKIETLLTAAGAGLSEPITIAKRGVPTSVPKRMIRFWYDGTGPSPFGSDTFGKTQDGLKLTIGVFIPIGSATSQAVEAKIDELLEEADAAIQAALWGDCYLGTMNVDNSTIGVEIGDSAADIVSVGGAAIRYLEIPITYGIPDRTDITP